MIASTFQEVLSSGPRRATIRAAERIERLGVDS